MGCLQWVNRLARGLDFAMIYGAFLAVLVAGCATGKEATQDQAAPFELIWAQAQPWVSGTPEGPTGMKLSFELSPPRTPVRFISLCYMQQTADLISRPNRPDEFSADYISLPIESEVKSQGCNIPALWESEANRADYAVLVYELEGLNHYFVIQDIVHKPLLAYPGRQ